ncbi:MAG: hypothetical protein ACSLFR_05175 [Solirubrobacteraceae bacterium]
MPTAIVVLVFPRCGKDSVVVDHLRVGPELVAEGVDVRHDGESRLGSRSGKTFAAGTKVTVKVSAAAPKRRRS